jgi:hypothetical protein
VSQWQVLELPSGVHVLPLNDLILHSHVELCSCAPRRTLHGSTCCGHLYMRELWTHNAMDGRE